MLRSYSEDEMHTGDCELLFHPLSSSSSSTETEMKITTCSCQVMIAMIFLFISGLLIATCALVYRDKVRLFLALRFSTDSIFTSQIPSSTVLPTLRSLIRKDYGVDLVETRNQLATDAIDKLQFHVSFFFLYFSLWSFLSEEHGTVGNEIGEQ